VPRNNVTPSRYRVLDKKTDAFLRFGDYMVDGEEIPGLVARGVLGFRFMLDRADFGPRFVGCNEPADVRRVLAYEGYYGNS